MRDPVAFVDLDGVLVDFVEGVLALHQKSIPRAEVRWDMEMQCGFTEATRAEFWAALGHDFWATLGWTDEGTALLAAIEGAFGDNVCLLTSPCATAGAVEGKVAWIRKHLPRYARRFFIGPPKYLIAGPGKVLIDDHEGNTGPFAAAGGTAILVPRPWNNRREETDSEGRFDVARLAGEIRAVRHSLTPEVARWNPS